MPLTLARLAPGMFLPRGEPTHQQCYTSPILKAAYSCPYATRRRAMDARQAMYHIANRKQWEARMNEIHAMLSEPMEDSEFHKLTEELCELKRELDSYYVA